MEYFQQINEKNINPTFSQMK